MKKLTKKQKKMRIEITLLLAVMAGVGAIGIASTRPMALYTDYATYTHKTASSTAFVAKNAPSSAGTIREVTAYNTLPEQTDGNPCVGAGGNICEALENGQKICAANFVPLGTKLKIQNYGVCIVLDRMAKRFQNRVDVAMSANEYDRAVKFGRQNLLVEIIK